MMISKAKRRNDPKIMMRKMTATAPDAILASQSRPPASVSFKTVKIGSIICAPFVTSEVGSTNSCFACVISRPLVDAPKLTNRSLDELMMKAPHEVMT